MIQCHNPAEKISIVKLLKTVVTWLTWLCSCRVGLTLHESSLWPMKTLMAHKNSSCDWATKLATEIAKIETSRKLNDNFIFY